MGDLADPRGRQEGQAHQASGRLQTGRFDEADYPTILPAQTGHDRARDCRRPSHPGLSGLEHPHGALEFERASVRHVDLYQEGRHGPMVAGSVALGIAGNTDWVRSP